MPGEKICRQPVYFGSITRPRRSENASKKYLPALI